MQKNKMQKKNVGGIAAFFLLMIPMLIFSALLLMLYEFEKIIMGDPDE